MVFENLHADRLEVPDNYRHGLGSHGHDATRDVYNSSSYDGSSQGRLGHISHSPHSPGRHGNGENTRNGHDAAELHSIHSQHNGENANHSNNHAGAGYRNKNDSQGKHGNVSRGDSHVSGEAPSRHGFSQNDGHDGSNSRGGIHAKQAGVFSGKGYTSDDNHFGCDYQSDENHGGRGHATQDRTVWSTSSRNITVSVAKRTTTKYQQMSKPNTRL